MTATHTHSHTHSHTTERPLYERVLKLIVVGGFTVLLLYLKALAGILKLGIKAVKSMPVGKKHDA